jgi:phosphate starvation-inducible membrane PsiE
MANKKCPFCAEDIKVDAIICKHCNSKLSEANSTNPVRSSQSAIHQNSDVKNTATSDLFKIKSSLSTQELLVFESEFSKVKKSKTTAYLLFFLFFGVLGSHQIYLGNNNLMKRYYIYAILGFILLSAQMNSTDWTSVSILGYSVIILFGIVALGCIVDLFTLGAQTEKANEKIEKNILLKFIS